MFDERKERLKLYSTSLLFKGGFWDGDQFADYFHENHPNVRWRNQQKSPPDELTYRLVMKYLIPKLPVPVRLVYYPTPHNGIRVHKDDWDELYTQEEIIVTITEEQLKEMADEVARDYSNV